MNCKWSVPRTKEKKLRKPPFLITELGGLAFFFYPAILGQYLGLDKGPFRSYTQPVHRLDIPSISPESRRIYARNPQHFSRWLTKAFF